MQVGDKVRSYDNDKEWFDTGTITNLDGIKITVDFMDWLQEYHEGDIEPQFMLYEIVLVAVKPGKTIQRF
jgi:hypothetical protein